MGEEGGGGDDDDDDVAPVRKGAKWTRMKSHEWVAPREFSDEGKEKGRGGKRTAPEAIRLTTHSGRLSIYPPNHFIPPTTHHLLSPAAMQSPYCRHSERPQSMNSSTEGMDCTVPCTWVCLVPMSLCPVLPRHCVVTTPNPTRPCPSLSCPGLPHHRRLGDSHESRYPTILYRGHFTSSRLAAKTHTFLL